MMSEMQNNSAVIDETSNNEASAAENTEDTRQVIADQNFDQERALYNTSNTLIRNCHFGGPADGESALKESNNFEVVDSVFDMRYCLWHDRNFILRRVTLNEGTRAPLWYDHHGLIEDCTLHSVKNIRECLDITFRNCDIDSEEFGWKCSALTFDDCNIKSVYGFLDSKNLVLRRVRYDGKYILQYSDNVLIEDSVFDTKDCLWHVHDVTVKNSTIKGEYLAWYSDGLTLINCHIESSQPLCYCKNLKLINCTMENCDRAFEYSDVDAIINGHIASITNPRSGLIRVGSVGEIIKTNDVMNSHAQIIIDNNNEI